MEWMLLPLKRYADFSGRSRRREYWMYALLQTIVLGLLVILIGAGAAGDGGEPGALFYLGMGLVVLWILGTSVPSVAVGVRRFHDQDKSGWLYLLSFIPYVGGIILLVFMCIDGTRGPNRFGSDPKDGNMADVFA